MEAFYFARFTSLRLFAKIKAAKAHARMSCLLPCGFNTGYLVL